MCILWQQASNLVGSIINEICLETCHEQYNKERVRRLKRLERKAFRRWQRRDFALRKQKQAA